MKLKMSEEEIVRNYRQAKEKTKQVQILADLNVCKPADIIEVLSQNGYTYEQLGRVAGAYNVKKQKPAPDEKPKPDAKPAFTSAEYAIGFLVKERKRLKAQIASDTKRLTELDAKIKAIVEDVDNERKD